MDNNNNKDPLADQALLAQLPPIPEVLRPGLDILFVGLNPGAMSGMRQLHFGNPQNYFWRGLHDAALVPRVLRPDEGHLLWDEWNMSIVNLVQRTTRSSVDLPWAEMRAAVPDLCRKLHANPPRIVCFVGKGIYQAFVARRRYPIDMGLQAGVLCLAGPEPQPQPQPQLRPLPTGARLPHGCAYVFVMPSTSGRTAAYTPDDKRRYFEQLGYVHRCAAEGAPIDHDRLEALGPQTRSRFFTFQ
ncbi:hypothetical protein H4R18_004449 [Coemansia javaensis]|uniref:Uracil-DNA glycosylase-like domain-containing protein n=1 Tax=Coemansia javaensis TaxID=2761396 RepID=A0A9W8LEU7_9FUNG|nr:hypothetical protein H4R18_004449 [Coemansia javaensis]